MSDYKTSRGGWILAELLTTALIVALALIVSIQVLRQADETRLSALARAHAILIAERTIEQAKAAPGEAALSGETANFRWSMQRSPYAPAGPS